MKNWKKNAMVASVLVMVCAGIYLNFVYTENVVTTSLTDTLDEQKLMDDECFLMDGDLETLGNASSDTASDYFAAVRLSRQEARDNALNLLQEAMAYAGSGSGSGKTVESSMEVEDIVQTALSEAQIESLILAKGYQDCVAYMSDEGISVAVSAPEGGLQQEDVAVIADVVMAQSDYGLTDIRVVEVQ